MNRKELIKKYLDFFKSKAHKEIPNVSLVPEHDPTVLFTTAGMHPLVPYLLGQKHPLGKRLVNVQRCLRTQDIEKVGDSCHHTFFEMLGNWSLGDYWKEQAIRYSFEFLTKVLRIPLEKIAVSVFGGDKRVKQISKDNESANFWLKVRIPSERIAFIDGGVLEKENNWWGPAGKTGPCGPDTEMFFWKSRKRKSPKKFNPEDENWVEIWNDVLMEYEKIEMDTILVDAIHCLIDEKKGLNKELADILKETKKRIIIVTNAPKRKIEYYLKDYDFEIFTLNKNPDKTDPEYFKTLINEFNLDINKIIYFDHSSDNLFSSKTAGIGCSIYKNNKQIKKFIEDNIFIYKPAKQKNIDTGMGVERTIAALSNLDDDYLTDCFLPIIKTIERVGGGKYGRSEDITRSMRIMADHVKAAVFIIGDGVIPGNVEQGYVLRRLIRRAVRHGRKLEMKNFIKAIAESVFEIYDDYKHLQNEKEKILDELEKEEKKFLETLEKGISVFEKLNKGKKRFSGKDAFLLYQSYGFPLEMILELAKEKGIVVDDKDFKEEEKEHQELSRTATEGRFKSGLSDKSEQTVRLHTATHLLNEALRKVLGNEVKQRGSNITPERLRFDFSFDRKLTDEEIAKVENLVNEKIRGGLNIVKEEMDLKKALESGAQAEFGHKYPEKVYVYTVLDNSEKRKWFSKEICTGPHVSNTKEIKSFKIIKEEASSAGVRRIKAELLDLDKNKNDD